MVDPLVEDVESFNTEQLINFLQAKNTSLGLNITDFKKFHDQRVYGSDFLKLTIEKLRVAPYKFLEGPARRITMLIDNLNSRRLFGLEKALSCVPLPIEYDPEVIISQQTTYSSDQFPMEFRLWDNLFEEVNNFHFDNEPKFERPTFSEFECNIEEDVRGAFYYNICKVLNKLLPDYLFSRRRVPIGGDPDFSAAHIRRFIMPIEIKREHDLRLLDNETILRFDETTSRYELVGEDATNVIRQIFTYMTEAQLQYGVLSTYQHHWFLRRPPDEPSVLYISSALPIQSQSPPVLKTYAYMVQVLCADNFFRNPPITTEKRKRQTVSYAGSTTKSFKKRRKTEITVSKRSSSSSTSKNSRTSKKRQTQKPAQDFSLADFKYNSILGQGRSGKTLLCEFRGNTIALKCADLSQNPHVLKEMQQEVNIYKILSDIQGTYIPKLVCYGFYCGMYYTIGMTLVGSALNNYKRITERQRATGLFALKVIHDRGVLHNDIREENILLDDINDVIYLIDFGISSYCDAKKSRSQRLFEEEERKLARLLDQYTSLDSVTVVE
ncbi:hypothetical protein RclHR1_09970005 [Rhizophagus clarus]|uniref:Kinase-like domain-containing protein n=1 Tax=Rhizophagus clarus TaxID=94130 RepID=A0A2Z6SFW9_9GLOM|nr:hypothetical protein RclHR1_09970005 [Rhizophagus clarus]GES77788.1 kinase-like domain-containing protein [Rhizophagus clarus]